MRQTTLLHNPRCSKSLQALELRADRGVALTVKRYLHDPLTVAEVDALVSCLGPDATGWVRTEDAEKLGVVLSDRSDHTALLRQVAEHPTSSSAPSSSVRVRHSSADRLHASWSSFES